MRTRRLLNERGQATVEFALIVPVLVLVIVGMIEFGRAFNYWISLNHLASEGARWAAVVKVPNPPNPAAPFSTQLNDYIKTQVLTKELKDEINSGNGGVIVCYKPANPAATTPRAGDAVTVTIKAPHNLGLVFMPKIPVTLTGSATMRLEQTPPDPANWSKCT